MFGAQGFVFGLRVLGFGSSVLGLGFGVWCFRVCALAFWFRA